VAIKSSCKGIILLTFTIHGVKMFGNFRFKMLNREAASGKISQKKLLKALV